jgi:hypothetical protein
MTMQLTVKGGRLNQPRCLEAVPAVFEGREIQFVPVGTSDDWLCQMASGKGKSTRPLARCKVLVELRRKAKTDHVAPTDIAIVDPMRDMLFEDSAPANAKFLTPKKQLRRDTSSSVSEVVVVMMKACPGASADAEDTQVLILTQGTKMLMEVNALPWLLNYLMDELESSGVDPVLESPKKSEPAIWWDFRDECWAGRFKTPDGGHTRKTASVRWRMGDGRDLGDMSFEQAKSVVYDEFASLQAASENPAASAVVEAKS